MPELPEVETVRRALAPVLEQRYIAAAFVGQQKPRRYNAVPAQAPAPGARFQLLAIPA